MKVEEADPDRYGAALAATAVATVGASLFGFGEHHSDQQTHKFGKCLQMKCFGFACLVFVFQIKCCCFSAKLVLLAAAEVNLCTVHVFLQASTR